MRFVARVVSMIFLVFAVIAGLVDAIQSVAAGQPVLTPLMDAWSSNSPETLALFQGLFASYLPAWVWDPGALWVLAQPAFAVFLVLSLIFYLAGHRRTRPAGRFAA
ncbi:MAG: hypothetical protein KUA43_15645 [Hoeflea sp.]|uniref:hypothetical protein n=1 Tax=Hoeflea sp. TaxID=1940281 RepID=UPI001D40AC5C|nr:hypothetical protein [Hoeflea sp.]MBU4531595.1 hypothetical protein [Alphaproteobacteria bacterium]MBU4544452.1 hypothetical protein [Alphaproteobacteria bacterium]MBU4550311.1 hypothetical protein [Alphaproteobacteria bacterium]MBV1724871.1 hypothetical protein [Hoeflea sp.]MBV1760891.1 hypothetical protein [Hoeflea sp.]